MPLLTGGSALAMGLPQIYAREGLFDATNADHRVPHVDGPAVVLSGSCSAMTQSQVAEYAEHMPSFQIDPVVLKEECLANGVKWLKEQTPATAPMFFATADAESVAAVQEQLGVDQAGALVEELMSKLAQEAFAAGVRRFVIAGGETSGAVTQALGVKALEIGPEIAPGVPWTYGVVDGERVGLALKSGNFGSETFFSDALRVRADA